jgi:type IV pilus assembly protein PilE
VPARLRERRPAQSGGAPGGAPGGVSGSVSGATLIELVVALAVLGILATLAVASYRGHVLRANRTEARTALLTIATAQEMFHLRCLRYAAVLDPQAPPDCDALALRLGGATGRGYYAVSITAADADGWTARALASGPPQDADTRCRAFELSAGGARRALDAARRDSSLECWGR